MSVPTRTLAGVTVPDTPLITKALEMARKYLSDMSYNHVVRSWLFGSIIASRIPDFKELDHEAHAISAILHDLGWDITGELISTDKRFEVDGADAARAFLSREGGSKWDKHRQQLVWDAIALHTSRSIALYKEIEVRATTMGILCDFVGVQGGPFDMIKQAEWDAIVKECPRTGFKQGVVDIMCNLCRTKPDTTYDNFVGEFGQAMVEGYSMEGKRVIDIIQATVD